MDSFQEKYDTNYWAQFLDEKGVTKANIKYFVDSLNEDKTLLKMLFYAQIISFHSIQAEKHEDEDVCKILKEGIGMNLLYASVNLPDILAKIKNKNLAKVLVGLNQENLLQLEFRGGEVPICHIARVSEEIEDNGYNYLLDSDEDDISEDENIVPQEYSTNWEGDVEIQVKAGMLITTSDVSTVLKEEIGIGILEKVEEKFAIFGDACVASDVDFGVEEGLYETLRSEKEDPLNKEVLKILENFDENNICEQKSQIVEFLSLDPSMEKYITSGKNMVGFISTYTDDFRDFILIELERMNLNLMSSMGDYFRVLKYYDVADPIFNLPMMWTPVLSYIESSSPYYREGKGIFSNDNYDRSSKVVYYGFSRGKIDPLLKSYYSRVQCYDDTGKYEEFKISKEGDGKFPLCLGGSFSNYERSNENVLLLNKYPYLWRTDKGNKDMMLYVSRILMGKIPGTERYFEVEGLRLAIRMIMPFKQNLSIIDGCYPFVVADTCSPFDLEIILIKLYDEDYEGINTHDRRIKSIKSMFPGSEVKNRMRVIQDKQDFIQYLRILRIRRIQGLIRRVDHMKEWHKLYIGSHNRKWFLASPQIPYLYFHQLSGIAPARKDFNKRGRMKARKV